MNPLIPMLADAADAAGAAPWYALKLADLIMILAVLAAPWVAIHIQWRLDVARQRRASKLQIFRTLMATRANRALPEHVACLNMIDIEFYGDAKAARRGQSDEDRAVADAWHVYLDSLDFGSVDGADRAIRNEKAADNFVDLLYAMSRALGYDFDRVLIRKGVYFPEAHTVVGQEDAEIRAGLARVLREDRPLKVMLEFPTPGQPASVCAERRPAERPTIRPPSADWAGEGPAASGGPAN